MKTHISTAAEMANLLLGYCVVKLSPQKVPFTWASGLKSPIYCGCRDLLSLAADADRGRIIEMLSDTAEEAFTSFLPDDSVVIVGAFAEAVPWSAMLAYKIGVPCGYVMSMPKAYEHTRHIIKRVPYGYVISELKDCGTGCNQPMSPEERMRLAKCLIGEFPLGFRVVIVEDLISTGVPACMPLRSFVLPVMRSPEWLHCSLMVLKRLIKPLPKLTARSLP